MSDTGKHDTSTLTLPQQSDTLPHLLMEGVRMQTHTETHRDSKFNTCAAIDQSRQLVIVGFPLLCAAFCLRGCLL